jgi:hypothetical protein
MACPHLGVLCRLLAGGVRSPRFKPRAARSTRAATGEGKTGPANFCEPSFASLSSILAGGMGGGGKGLAAEER